MKKLLNEFKEFALRGNVIDMAIGVIIGGAFSKIVTSLVNDIIMPVISLILGRINLTDLAITVMSFNNAPIAISYGVFLQNVLDLLIVSACIFAVIKMINIFRKKQQPEEPKKPEEPAPSKEEVLLAEIRDILKNGR